MCNIESTRSEATDKLTGGRAHQTRERHAMLASIHQQLASHYEFLAAALSGSDSAIYGRENRA